MSDNQIQSATGEGYRILPRGGYLVDTSLGYIQIGSPPETIKDTMQNKNFPQGTPNIFVLPDDFFHVNKGISVAEVEFPLYYNHFIRQKNMFVVCTPEQKAQLEIVLQHAVFGPEQVDVSSEFINGEKTFGYPDLMAEMKYFRGGRVLGDLLEFAIFDNEGKAYFKWADQRDRVIIHKLQDGDILIEDVEWRKRVQVPGKVNFRFIYDTGERSVEPFKPPLFGITCLGPSHGFDVKANTSGFIIWLQNNGVMIDPPVNSTEWLRESNVNPKHIDSVILTHAHADHDAGTFQKILEEGRIRIYSTETVMYSFLTKYSALTKIPVQEILELFEFIPVVIGTPYVINGAVFNFHYSLHSIPTFGFQFVFLDQSFVYSSDHLNDPKQYEEMRKSGILTESRYQDLMNFPWFHNVIYHESGIPPLHTQVSYLETLPKEVQCKMTIYHIAEKDVPKNSLLTLAKYGINETVYPPITAPRFEKSIQLLDVLSGIDIFQNFPLAKAKDFLEIIEEEKFDKRSTIIAKGTPGDKFYIIISGNVRVEGYESEKQGKQGDETTEKRFGNYEYFGEASLIMDTVRSASVIAETEVVALTIEKPKFLHFIKGSDLKNRFIRLVEIRKSGSWDILSSSRFLKGITSAQKTQLELIMHPEIFGKGENFIKANERMEAAFIVKTGNAEVIRNDRILETLSRGDFCGQIYQLQKNQVSTFTFKAATDMEVFRISKTDLSQYLIQNPGVYMRMFFDYGTESKEKSSVVTVQTPGSSENLKDEATNRIGSIHTN